MTGLGLVLGLQIQHVVSGKWKRQRQTNKDKNTFRIYYLNLLKVPYLTLG
uniref:Uncharacterized protein n=1 Tax=Arundo donax TaxID=35708 RepID=A0A0A9EI19_ARUDO